MNRFYIQLLGTTCSGKSSLAACIGLSYNVEFSRRSEYQTTKDKTLIIAGKYYFVPRDNIYRGGLDTTDTHDNKTALVRKCLDLGYKITLSEGYISMYLHLIKRFIDGFDITPLFIQLDVPLNIIAERLKIRSGRTLDKKSTYNNVMGKKDTAEKMAQKLSAEGLKVFTVPNATPKDRLNILELIELETSIKMQQYITEVDLWRSHNIVI